MDDENEVIACSYCGGTETYDLNDEDEQGREQSITICATCGSDN